MGFVKALKRVRDNYVINQVKNIELPEFGESDGEAGSEAGGKGVCEKVSIGCRG